MGWKLTGGASGIDADVDTTFKALRISIRPAEVSGWYSVGARSGAATTVAAAGAVFSLRQLASTLLIVRRLGVGYIGTSGFTAAQELAYALVVARAFSASDTGGTAIALTGSNAKMRTSLGTPTSVDARIATTAALTAGTKTLDSTPLSITGSWAPTTAGVVLAPSLNNLLSHDAGDYPLVLAQNEGLNVQNVLVMGAGGAGTIYVSLELCESAAY